MKKRPPFRASVATAVLALLCLPLTLEAQAQGAVSGEVTDASSGRPLPGAQVYVPNTQFGTLTDNGGRYRLELPAGDVTVEVRAIGYATTQQSVNLTAGQVANLNFALRPRAIELDEIVVTGAGVATERRKLGNTIGTISSDELEGRPIQTFSEILQGREVGVTALPNSGITGEGTKIRIRGSASLSQANEPIIYVDGVRVDNGGGFANPFAFVGGMGTSRLDDIPPESIERIEILKGSAAATLYGTEAANGVIQIFTKKGQEGTPRWELNHEMGVLDYPDGRYKMNAGFARTPEQAAALSAFYGQSIQPFQIIERPFVARLFETGWHTNTSLSVSGGSSLFKYFVTGRFQREDGPFGAEDLGPARDIDQRIQGAVNLTITPSDKFQIRVSSLYTDNDLQAIENNNNIFGVVSLAMFGKPELAECFSDIIGPETCADAGNPTGQVAFATVREAMQTTIEQSVEHFTGTVGAGYEVTPDVNLDLTVGVDMVNQQSAEFTPFGWNLDQFAGSDITGIRAASDRNRVQLSLDGKASWNTNIGDRFTSTFLVGGQAFITQTEIKAGLGDDFPGPGLEVTGAGAIQNVFENFLEEVIAGAYAQEQIGFDDWAFLTLGARYDRHSAFGEDADPAFYPKASISLVPSSWSTWDSETFSTVRVRAAVGESGLQPGAFDKFTTFAPQASELGPGLSPDNLGNSELKPEVSLEWELGAEVGVLNDRASLDVTYWDRRTRDALYARQFAPSGGFLQQQLVNIGELTASGLEISANGVVIDNEDLRISVFANASYLKEEITDLGGAPPLKVGGSYPRYRNFLMEGEAPGAFFGAKLLDVGPNQVPYDTNNDGSPDTMDEFRTFLSQPRRLNDLGPSGGTPLLADDDGDGDPLDHYLGKPMPDWAGAFGLNVGFLGNFELSTLFEYKFGNFTVFNLTDAFRKSNPVIGRNVRAAAEVEATIENPSSTADQRVDAAMTWATELKALSPASGLNSAEVGDFVRWREASLTYRAPTSFARRLGLSSLSFVLKGRNLVLWTGYSGIDPEANVFGRGGDPGSLSLSSLDNNFGLGTEAFGFPLPRRFSLAVRASF